MSQEIDKETILTLEKEIIKFKVQALKKEYEREIEFLIKPTLENEKVDKSYFIGRQEMLRKVIIDLEELLK